MRLIMLETDSGRIEEVRDGLDFEIGRPSYGLSNGVCEVRRRYHATTLGLTATDASNESNPNRIAAHLTRVSTKK